MASYCAACGGSLSSGARFCSVCGNAVTEPGRLPQPIRPFIRPLAGRKVAGVCRGLADRYGWDVTLTRVITVLLAVGIFPVGVIAYLLMWLMVPEELRSLAAPATNLNTVR